MICPKCFSDNISTVGTSHYVCNNPNCYDNNGNRTQFQVEEDKKIMFPYNQIFVNRNKHEFYRKPYLQLASVGVTEI